MNRFLSCVEVILICFFISTGKVRFEYILLIYNFISHTQRNVRAIRIPFSFTNSLSSSKSLLASSRAISANAASILTNREWAPEVQRYDLEEEECVLTDYQQCSSASDGLQGSPYVLPWWWVSDRILVPDGPPLSPSQQNTTKHEFPKTVSQKVNYNSFSYASYLFKSPWLQQ